ncbi:MAG: class C beta-lactamase-related serine hydrolase [Deltaproteobacteria bacterium]|nr:MAG: class C beta-lactamase-related serine hydrolase [Deltaproteobacteria bacterium]
MSVRSARKCSWRGRWLGGGVFLLALVGISACPPEPEGEVPDPVPSEVDCESIYMRPGHGETFYENNPTYLDRTDDTSSWTFSTPEAEGMDPAILAEGVRELEESPSLFGFILIRHDAIVLERYFNGSGPHQSNNVHSASKSILSALVGIALREGFLSSLDEAVASILPEYFRGENDDFVKKQISLFHLLTMTTGLFWVEDETEYEIEETEDWIASILAQPMVHLPGRTFNYSTGASHVTSALLTRATGMDTCTFAHRYLFGHLGITAEHWGRDPQGYFSGGYNLYLTARELAKFGLLYLHEGRWEALQVVPESWVTDSLTRQTGVDIQYDYGFYWWLTRVQGYDLSTAWGYGGQFIHLLPELDIVVVFTANTRNEYDELDSIRFIRNHILPAVETE